MTEIWNADILRFVLLIEKRKLPLFPACPFLALRLVGLFMAGMFYGNVREEELGERIFTLNTKLVVKDGQTYLECIPSDWRLEGEREALDLVAACVENRTYRLMLHADSLTGDFYRLRTGLAGAILQKFANYRIRVAAVIPPDLGGQGRFREMVLEANRGNQFRVFQARDMAEQWLMEG